MTDRSSSEIVPLNWGAEHLVSLRQIGFEILASPELTALSAE